MKYKDLIDKMTLEEKASLMSGKDFWQSQDIERLGIPSMFLSDGPHGIRKQAEAADHLGLNASIPATCFPTAAAIANSWNEELGEKVGDCLGEEAVAQKVNVLLGPGINIKRNPFCGRNFEYFSEDPYLTGKMASAYIRGIQSRGISACVKHFCANNQEMNRMTIDTLVDERTLREIYLTGFEMAIKEGGSRSLMSSYNRLNGTYTNENLHVMKEILRDEWGFDGCVITDWGGGNDRVEGLKAGNELEMPTNNGETDREIIAAVKEGRLNESVLNENVDRLLNLIFTTEEVYKETRPDFDRDKHHEAARRAAEESIVLLKNEDAVLPLSKEKTVAVIGDFAEKPRYQGAGSSVVNPTKLDNTLECLKDSGLTSIGYEKGFDRYGKKNLSLLKKACALAKTADVVLLYLGLDEVTEAEGMDRTDMSLPANQIELLASLYEFNRNIIVVLSCGSSIEMPWIGKAKGLVHAYLSGQAGAGAIINILTGAANPSGKLAESYPFRYGDTPSAANFPGLEVSVEYREGPYVGYRYFDTVGKDVLFPFGYGLSYTEFAYSDLRIDDRGATVKITNTGSVAGKEVVQLYVGLEGGKVFRPGKELKGFAKVSLESGESCDAALPFDDKTFRYFNVKTDKWEIEEGNYTISIGASSADIRLTGTLAVKGTEAPLPYEAEALPSYFSGEASAVGREEFETLLGFKAPDPLWDRSVPLGFNDTVAQCAYAKGGFARFAFALIRFGHWFLRKIGQREAANTIKMFIWHMPFRGMSRMSGGAINRPMLDGLLTIVNGHFFKGLGKTLKELRIMLKNNKRG